MAKVTWFGHAAFKIEVANRVVLIDPWRDDNPTSPIKASEITEVDIVIPKHYKTFRFCQCTKQAPYVLDEEVCRLNGG